MPLTVFTVFPIISIWTQAGIVAPRCIQAGASIVTGFGPAAVTLAFLRCLFGDCGESLLELQRQLIFTLPDLGLHTLAWHFHIADHTQHHTHQTLENIHPKCHIYWNNKIMRFINNSCTATRTVLCILFSVMVHLTCAEDLLNDVLFYFKLSTEGKNINHGITISTSIPNLQQNILVSDNNPRHK